MQRSAASSTSRHDTLAVREALSQENAKRDAALQARERSGSAASIGDTETRWELSYVTKLNTGSAKVVDWGYGELVGSHEEEDRDEEGVEGGRMVFGQFKRKSEVSQLLFLGVWFEANIYSLQNRTWKIKTLRLSLTAVMGRRRKSRSSCCSAG